MTVSMNGINSLLELGKSENIQFVFVDYESDIGDLVKAPDKRDEAYVK